MAKYKVLTPIELDGKRVEPGKTLEIDDDTAQPLAAVGAVELAPTKGKAADGNPDPAA